jgi:hypothetical protein
LLSVIQPWPNAIIESPRFVDGDALLPHKQLHHRLGEEFIEGDFRSESHIAPPYRQPSSS